jgi:peptide/nickel transport system substrate-binding protein
MGKKEKELTRREFLELAALGTAGAAAYGLGGAPLFAATPKRGGTVTCGMAWMIQTVDPHVYIGMWARQASALAWEGLTTPTPLGERFRISAEKGPDAVPLVQPMLADSWEFRKGGKQVAFSLKKGVKFHNGKEMDSADVKWNWERIRDPANRAGARTILTLFLKSIETPDKYTIVANLEQPYPAFLVANAWCNSVILPKDSIPHGVTWGRTPTFKPPSPGPPGTGPFKLTKFQQKFEGVFERFEDYRAPGLPYLDKVVFKVLSKDIPRTLALRAGDVDYIWGSEPKWATKVTKGKELHRIHHLEKEGLKIMPVLHDRTRTILLNCHDTIGDSPFKDVRVRQALEYCIDRKKLAKVVYGDMAIPWGQAYHPDISSWGYPDVTWKEPDIEKAKQLLKEAGYPNGVDVEFKITPTQGRNDIMAQVVQQMTRPAGFRIKITSLLGVQYWVNLRKYTYHMFAFGIDMEDPMNKVYPWLHTTPDKPFNGYAPVSGAKDPYMDKLLDDQASEIDFQKRKAKFKKVVQYANDESYMINYWKEILCYAWSDRLNNFKPLNYYYPEQAFVETWVES